MQDKKTRPVFQSFTKPGDSSLSNSSSNHFRIEFVVLVACLFHLLVRRRQASFGSQTPSIFRFADAKHLSVVRGTISPATSEPMLAIIAAVCVANPIIYTIASKRFLTVIQRACDCCLCFRRRNKELLLVAGPSDTRVLLCQQESVTENTEETSLFPEVD